MKSNATYKELEILEWGSDRGILPGNKDKQALKMVSEVGECCDNVCKDNNPIDDIGDIYVTLVLLANQHGLTMERCIDHAYAEIESRTGETVDGVFIKDV